MKRYIWQFFSPIEERVKEWSATPGSELALRAETKGHKRSNNKRCFVCVCPFYGWKEASVCYARVPLILYHFSTHDALPLPLFLVFSSYLVPSLFRSVPLTSKIALSHLITFLSSLNTCNAKQFSNPALVVLNRLHQNDGRSATLKGHIDYSIHCTCHIVPIRVPIGRGPEEGF